jgi:hypothetical protein
MVELHVPRITLSTQQKLRDCADTVTVALERDGGKFFGEGRPDPCRGLGVQESREITQDGSQGKSMSENSAESSTLRVFARTGSAREVGLSRGTRG